MRARHFNMNLPVVGGGGKPSLAFIEWARFLDEPKEYAVADMPPADEWPRWVPVFVTDETGGAVLAFSDGTDWRRCTDRAVVS